MSMASAKTSLKCPRSSKLKGQLFHNIPEFITLLEYSLSHKKLKQYNVHIHAYYLRLNIVLHPNFPQPLPVQRLALLGGNEEP